MVLSTKEREYVLSARALGAPDHLIIRRHILPNTLGPITVVASFALATTIITEASLSFLGLGVPPPAPSWGNMIATGQQTLSATPRHVLLPSAFLFVTVLAFNLLGDALRSRWSVR